MFDPIISDIEPLDIRNSDLDLAVYLELREDPTVVLVDRWKEFFRDFYDGPREDFQKNFNRFCKYWKNKNREGFKFPGIKACTLTNGRQAFYDLPYNPSGIVPEQEVGTILFPCRLTKEAEYEMHHDYSEEAARRFEYTGPWVSALMVQAKMERTERYEATTSWLEKVNGRLEKMHPEQRDRYLRESYRTFWRCYFKAQRANAEKGYGDQSKPLTILQRMDVKHQFQFLADTYDVDLGITWPEGDGPRTLHDILQDKKQRLSELYDGGDMSSLVKAEELEQEIEAMEQRLRVDEASLAPWISEYMTGRERENPDGEVS